MNSSKTETPISRRELGAVVSLSLLMLLCGLWLLGSLATQAQVPEAPAGNPPKPKWVRAPANMRVKDHFDDPRPEPPPVAVLPPIPPAIFETIARAEEIHRAGRFARAAETPAAPVVLEPAQLPIPRDWREELSLPQPARSRTASNTPAP